MKRNEDVKSRNEAKNKTASMYKHSKTGQKTEGAAFVATALQASTYK